MQPLFPCQLCDNCIQPVGWWGRKVCGEERKTVNLNLPQHKFRVPFVLYLFIFFIRNVMPIAGKFLYILNGPLI
jgi:hypothetical protein